MKFGGMSTPWGIFFYGENYESSIIKGKLKLSKNDKPGKHVIYVLMVVYLIYDVVINFTTQIKTGMSYLISFLPEIPYHINTNTWTSLVSIHFNFSVPEWLIGIVVTGITVSVYVFFIWFMYKVRGYHGAEHKAILSAIRGDVSKAHSAPRITSHCGSNLLIPYVVFAVMFYEIGYFMPGTSMILSFVLYQKIPQTRRYISYMGSYVQRITTKEPSDKELKEAQRGIKSIINAEEMRIYRHIKPFFVQMPMRP